MVTKILIAAGLVVSLVVVSNGRMAEAHFTWPPPVEAALQLSGENRRELESLLVAYQKDEDQLKFKAACFLIENMPGHYYVEAGLPTKFGSPRLARKSNSSQN